MPALCANLAALGVEERLLARLRDARRETWAANRALFSATLPVIAALEEAGIKTILLKGSALVATGALESSGRPMSDVDVLVPTQAANEAIEQLVSLGLKPLGRTPAWYVSEYVPRFSPSFSFARPGAGAQVDLHWHALHASRQHDADDAFWNAALAVELDQVATRALCPADALLHAVVHGLHWAPIPSYRWVLDASMIIGAGAGTLDYDRLVEQARLRRTAVAVHAGLRYLRDLIDAPVPSETLRALAARRPLVERRELAALMSAPSRWTARERLLVHYGLYARQHGSLADRPGPLERLQTARECFGVRRLGDLRYLRVGGAPGPGRPLTTGHAAIGKGDATSEAVILAVGKTLDLTKADWAGSCVSYGVWLPEPAPEGCWIAGREARLSFALRDAPSGSLLLDVWGGHRLVGTGLRARLELHCGREKLAAFVVTGERLDLNGACVLVPARVIAGRERLDLVIRAPDATSAAQLGVGEDDRPLGFCLRKIGVRSAPRYKLGELLDYAIGGTGSRSLAGGWSAPETTGCWSDGPAANLVLALDERSDGLELTLEAEPFLGVPARSVRVDVLAAGEQVGRLIYEARDPDVGKPRSIPLEARHVDRYGELALTLAIRGPRSPFDLGLSDDRRLLGLHLRSLVLRARPGHAAPGAVAQR
jgi:hypothetical protein